MSAPSSRRVLNRTGIIAIAVALVVQLTMVFVGQSTANAAVTVPPTFSVAHGFYDAAFDLALATTTPGASINYTVDGSTPSATAGTLYSTPITISGTTVVRAIAYVPNADPTLTVSSTTVTQTYLFTGQIVNQSNTPAGYPTSFAPDDMYGTHPADYEMDPEIVGTPRYGAALPGALKSIPSISITTDVANLFDPATGIYVRPETSTNTSKPISFELIDPTGATAGVSKNAEIRMRGESSRQPQNTPKQSFRVDFKGANKFTYNMFTPANATDIPKTTFDQLVLRHGGSKSWSYADKNSRRETDYVNDEFARDAYLDMGHLSPHGTYANLYINGLYWGLYNTTERPSEKMLVSYLGGADADYDVITADEDLGDAIVAQPGDLVAYDAVMALIAGTDPIDDVKYADLASKVDLAELSDYMLLAQYTGKTDWPNHNFSLYRRRSGADQKFHFLAWDNESGLNKLSENITPASLADAGNTPNRLFVRLTSNAQFRALYSTRANAALNATGPLSPTACAARYSQLTTTINQAVIAESARWGDYSRDVYTNAVNPGKSSPAYLHSYDMSYAEADPANAVADLPTAQKNWVEVVASKLDPATGYCALRSGIVLGQLAANGWYTAPVDPNAPTTTTTVPVTTTTTPVQSASLPAGLLVPITPTRIADTRPAPENVNVTVGRISAGGSRAMSVANTGGLPSKSQISAVVLNVTSVNAAGPGYLSVYPATSPVPSSSTLNYEKNTVKANQVTVPLGTDGKIRVFAGVSASDVVVDVTGYYTAADSDATTGNALTNTTQARLLDSRNGTNSPTIAAGDSREVCPAGATSGDVANFAVTGVNSASSIFVTAYPSGIARPFVSALNNNPSAVTANMVMSPVGANGCVTFYVSGTTDLVVDVLARWTPSTGGAGRYVSLATPTRFYDTRPGSGYTPTGITGAGSAWDLPLAGVDQVPGGARAVLGNLTAVDALNAGYMKVYPSGTQAPTFSNVNFAGAAPVANAFMTGVGSGASYGGAAFYHHSGGYFIVDVAGYYTAS